MTKRKKGQQRQEQQPEPLPSNVALLSLQWNIRQAMNLSHSLSSENALATRVDENRPLTNQVQHLTLVQTTRPTWRQTRINYEDTESDYS